MTDLMATFGSSEIQHGKENNRVYLISLSSSDMPDIIDHLDQLAVTNAYSKIFAKVPAAAKSGFIESGYIAEANIPGFYCGREEVFFMGKYFSSERRSEQKPEIVKEALEIALAKEQLRGKPVIEEHLICRQTGPEDANAMAQLYREVFATYPFPIHDPAYLKETMETNVIYFGIWESDELIALASAEIDHKGQNAEMTDFATQPESRSRGFANYLLHQAEAAAAKMGVKTAYTIARAYSPGMNITFARNGYSYSGTLTQNTQISGTLESMNVWHKELLP
ncbi:MAG: putative beta-lysine N-acetyltransferase [Desulfuromonadaceae bacterium]|nr:putative beta-lysine N-acetyltransferase [Desulfuromonadaceae bacterium]MDD2856235.1 putative beta-lysine N-acetyltransferase [Desulfuromonadaceae bacterium]